MSATSLKGRAPPALPLQGSGGDTTPVPSCSAGLTDGGAADINPSILLRSPRLAPQGTSRGTDYFKPVISSRSSGKGDTSQIRWRPLRPVRPGKRPSQHLLSLSAGALPPREVPNYPLSLLGSRWQASLDCPACPGVPGLREPRMGARNKVWTFSPVNLPVSIGLPAARSQEGGRGQFPPAAMRSARLEPCAEEGQRPEAEMWALRPE